MPGSGFFAAAAAAYQAHLEAKTARRNTDATNRANQQMAEYGYNRDLTMWQQGNQYNSPEAQMSRLRDAGLNPMMVYGSGNAAGNASSQLPKYQVPRMEYNYKTPVDLPGMIGMYQDVAMRAAQIDNVKAQTRSTDASVGLGPYAKAKSAISDMRLKGLKLEQASEQRKYFGEVAEEQARSAHMQNEQREAELLFKKYRNEWMRMGVTSSDHIMLRAMVRMMSEAGLSYDTFKSE